MFLKEIYLKNYKCFEEKTFSFEKRFTVLIGDNGSGKTALLDGVADSLRPFINRFSNNKFSFNENKIRRKSIQLQTKKNLELIYPTEIRAVVDIDNVQIEFPKISCLRIGKYQRPAPSIFFNEYAQKLENGVSGGNGVVLPMIAFYKTDRLWSKEDIEKKDVKLHEIGSRFMKYEDSLNPHVSDDKLLEWFKRMKYIEIQDKKTPPELTAVSEAVQKAIQSLSEKEGFINFDVRSDELMIDIGNGEEFPMQMLSDGYRNTLGLIADIAYRMAELNPHVTTDTPGVVLIDEIDLHLHPKWQRNIVGDLKRIFPNCQFIVTTHSPFIIQSLDVDDGIIRLDNEYEEVPEDFVNQSIEDIAEDMQGVENPQWSRKKTEMYEAAKQYFNVLEKMNSHKDATEIQKLREELELLKKPYASNVAYLAFLEQKTLVKEAQLQRDMQVVNDPEPQPAYKKNKEK